MEPPHTKPPLSRAQKDLRFALRVLWLLARGFALAAMLIVALAAAAAFAIPKFFDGERMRGMLVAQAERVLHRRVEVEGLTLTPHGIKLRGVRVRDSDPSAPPLIEGEYALMTIKLRPLLQKRLELSDVRLASPKIRLARDENGTWSVADLFVSSGAVASQPRWELPISLAAQTVSVENGSLQIDDKLRGQTVRVDKINVAVDGFNVDKPFHYKLACDDATRVGESLVKAALAAEGTISLESLDWEKAFAHADRFQATLDGRVFKGSAKLIGFKLPRIEAEVSAQALGPADWKAATGKDVELNLPESRWKAAGRFVESRAAALERLELSAGGLTASASGTVSWRVGEPAKFEGELSSGEFPLAEAAAWRPALERYELKGTGQARADVSATAERLLVRKAEAKGRGVEAVLAHAKVERADFDLVTADDFARIGLTVSRGTVYAFSNVFSETSLALRVVGRDLRLERLSAKWAGHPMRLRGRVVDLANPKQVSVFGSAERIRWEEAQQLITGTAQALASSTRPFVTAEARKSWVSTFKYVIPRRFPDTIGRVHVSEIIHKDFHFKDADLLWDLRGVTPSLDSVNGEARVGFGPGRVEDIQAVQSYHKFLRIVFLPYIYMHKMNSLSVLSAATAYPKTLDFNRIEGQYEVAKGVAHTRFLHIDSPQLLALAEGRADFGRENVDMSILTRLTAYRAPLPQWWTDELGRPAIGFRVKGDLNQPELEPRLHKIGANEIEELVEDRRAKAKTRFESIEKLDSDAQIVPAPKSAVAKENAK